MQHQTIVTYKNTRTVAIRIGPPISSNVFGFAEQTTKKYSWSTPSCHNLRQKQLPLLLFLEYP